jgi:acetoin utilization deacetylase AcuC-like enzyme
VLLGTRGRSSVQRVYLNRLSDVNLAKDVGPMGTAASLAVMPLAALLLRPTAPLLTPAGHSAKRDLGTGGSYYNNAAVAVRAAQAAGAERVLVLDWDVHHCAGTQAVFQEDPMVLVVSLHWFEQ